MALNTHENKLTSSKITSATTSNDADDNMQVVITYSPKNPYYTQTMNESRLDYLKRFPMLLQAGTNSYNLEKLKELIDEVVTKDCLIKTPHLEAYRGRDTWYDQLITVLNAIPYLFVAYTSPMLFRRCIVMKQYNYGTTGALIRQKWIIYGIRSKRSMLRK